MPDFVIKVLDTANPTASPSDTGPTQTMQAGWLKRNVPLRFSIDIGSGDTVVIEGKSLAAEDFEILHSFIDEIPADIFVSAIWQVRRTVDGAGESQVFIENPHNQVITEDSA